MKDMCRLACVFFSALVLKNKRRNRGHILKMGVKKCIINIDNVIYCNGKIRN